MMTSTVTDARPPPAREQTDGLERRLFGGLNVSGMAGVFRVPRRPVIRAVFGNLSESTNDLRTVVDAHCH